MVGSDGNCNDAARAAIRLVFHDCFPGACDGSIILSDECTSRPENAQLTGICKTLGDKAKQFKVSTADIIQLGGAVGIAACPGGPRISFKAGRTDSNQANPPNQLPSPNSTAAVLLQAFSSKGYSATELVALVGAHTAAKRIDGAALDTSVSTWDTKFYAETANGTAPATLPSDDNLSKASETKQMWNNFAKDSRGWTGAFVPAMTKLGLMGNDEKSLVDCSDVIAKSFA
ncbi:peroxidase [Thozetella sp. PMI_491]|nr:peroxidase [Thozetella sp. PMI_491]